MAEDEPVFHLPSSILGGRNAFFNYVAEMFSQCNDLCSHFSRFMNPAYYHDRCDRSVRMRLYSMEKGEFVLAFLVFFKLVGLAIVIGLSGPPMEYLYTKNASYILNCARNESQAIKSCDILSKRGKFTFTSPPLTRYNKKLWLSAVIYTNNSDEEKYEKYFEFNSSIKGISGSTNFNHSDEDSHKNKIFINSGNRTRQLKCHEKICKQVPISHISFISYTRYIFTVHLYHLETFHQKYHIQEISFHLKSFTTEYTKMEMTFRIVFVVISFIFTVWFVNSLKKYPVSDWCYEQKWMATLLPAVFFYNGPTYPMNILIDHWIFGMANNVFQITFIFGLMGFWMCTYHAFRQNERPFKKFYSDKLAILLLLWMLSLMVAYYKGVKEYKDNTYNFESDEYAFQMIFLLLRMMGGFYLGYLTILIFKAYIDLHTMPFFDKRISFLSWFMVITVVIGVMASIMHYGISSLMHEKFVSEIEVTHENSALFMNTYAFLNFYIYICAFVYAPAQKYGACRDHAVTKDNPAYSMVHNFSDDDEEDVTLLWSREQKDEGERGANKTEESHFHTIIHEVY